MNIVELRWISSNIIVVELAEATGA